MSKRFALVGVVSLAALLVTGGLLVAQEGGRGEEGRGAGISGDLKSRCQNVIKNSQILRESSITCREEGSGKIICEGSVPTKVHACALFVSCMQIDGVRSLDLSRLKIEEEGMAGGDMSGHMGRDKGEMGGKGGDKGEMGGRDKGEMGGREGMGGSGGRESGMTSGRNLRFVGLVVDEQAHLADLGKDASSMTMTKSQEIYIVLPKSLSSGMMRPGFEKSPGSTPGTTPGGR
jgi:hypothetical protein